MKKILMISLSNFPDVRILREANALIKNSYKVTIISYFELNKSKYEQINENLSIMRLFHKPNFGKGNIVRCFCVYIWGVIELFQIILRLGGKFKQYDLIHLHNPPEFLILPLLLEKIIWKNKIVLDRHEPFALSISSILNKTTNSILFKLLSALELILIRFVDGVVVINKFEKNYILKNTNKKVVIVGNGFDVKSQRNTDINKRSDFEIKKENFGFSDSIKIILYQGLISKRRDLDTVIDLFNDEEFSKKYGLIILGDGDFKSNLRKRIEKLKFSDRIKLCKAVEPADVEKYIEMADICLVTAKNIPLYQLYTPNKLFEYLIHNKIVIISQLKNLLSLSQNLLPYYVPENTKSLQIAIEKSRNIKEEEIEIIAKKILKANDWNKDRKRLLNFYKELLK